VHERSVTPTGALARRAFPFPLAHVDLGVVVLHHVVDVVEVQVCNQHVADVFGIQAELAQLRPAALVLALRDRLGQHVGGPAIHLGHVGQARIDQHRLVTA